MKKQIIIENCDGCPNSMCLLPSSLEGDPTINVYCHIARRSHDGEEIPDWCPLEDADNEETHYMVPKPFLRVIYSTISGIITKKELDDSLSEADDALWMIREKIKNITGHGD